MAWKTDFLKQQTKVPVNKISFLKNKELKEDYSELKDCIIKSGIEIAKIPEKNKELAFHAIKLLLLAIK